MSKLLGHLDHLPVNDKLADLCKARLFKIAPLFFIHGIELVHLGEPFLMLPISFFNSWSSEANLVVSRIHFNISSVTSEMLWNSFVSYFGGRKIRLTTKAERIPMNIENVRRDAKYKTVRQVPP